MSFLSVAARFAVRWLGRIVSFVQTPVGQEFAVDIFGRVVGEKIPGYIRKLRKVEETIGAHTDFWGKLTRAHKSKMKDPSLRQKYEAIILELERGGYAVLDPHETRYGFVFKKLWDKHVKRPINRALDRMDLESDDLADDYELGLEEGTGAGTVLVGEGMAKMADKDPSMGTENTGRGPR